MTDVGMASVKGAVLANAAPAARFAVVGVAATLTHLLVLWVLLETTALHVVPANVCAFLIAFLVSFGGHYHFTFRKQTVLSRALPRFFAVAAAGCLANTVVLAALVKAGVLSDMAAAAIAMAAIPAVTFVSARFWAFRETGAFKPSAKNDRLTDLALPAAIGAVLFLIIVGPQILDPTNIAWLQRGDSPQHYLGWAFFRDTPWSWPPGLNPRFGIELGSSIVFSDSIPLIAIPLKALSPLLPDPFQYFGLWIFACFLLQAVFAFRLVSLFTDDRAQRLVATVFFVAAPFSLFRLFNDTTFHMSLFGHFLILAALYGVLRPQAGRTTRYWLTLLCVSVLVHFYLFAMVGLFWIVGLRRAVAKQVLSTRQAVAELGAAMGLVGVLGYLAGYFAGGSAKAGGFGVYKANLLTMIDANGWSHVLGDIAGSPQEVEGFNYMGLGTLMLGAVALGLVILRRVSIRKPQGADRLLYIPVGLLLLTAVTHHIGLGSWQIELPLIAPLVNLGEVVRASGRMLWPVSYLVTLGVIFAVVKGLGRRPTTVVLGLAAVIQIADLRPVWQPAEPKFAMPQARHWPSPLVDPFWSLAGERYRVLRTSRPQEQAGNWMVLADLARAHGMATDIVYVARVNHADMKANTARAAARIAEADFEDDTLYILDDAHFAQLRADARLDRRHLVATVDGLHLLAPNWNQPSL